MSTLQQAALGTLSDIVPKLLETGARKVPQRDEIERAKVVVAQAF
jgi:hypothetical protein